MHSLRQLGSARPLSLLARGVRKRFLSAIPRALVFGGHGEPAEVVSVATLAPLAPPSANQVTLKFILSPINPADINVVQGVYPSKPTLRSDVGTPNPVFIGGNEGLAQVSQLGENVSRLKIGDWVVMRKQQVGTWSSHANLDKHDVVRVPREEGSKLSEVNAATMSANPPTAFRMLHDFANLSPGDYVIQNGANSAVGQAVIQIAAERGLKTINLVRERPGMDDLKTYLNGLGATHVLTYSDLLDKNTKGKIREWTGGKPIQLGLNCVGGRETTVMAGLLGKDAHLVSYGAMSKAPLSLPTSLFIFKNLTSHGFWMTQWYADHSLEERQKMATELVSLMESGKLREPAHEVLSITGDDAQATSIVREAFQALSQGSHGKKMLLRFDE